MLMSNSFVHQLVVGFLGSLLASMFVAIFADISFRRTIKSMIKLSEDVIVKAISELKETSLTIANQIENLASIADKIREVMERRV